MPNSESLNDGLFAAALTETASCLAARGRSDLLETAELTIRFFGRTAGNDPFLYPEPEQLLQEGLATNSPTLPGALTDELMSGDGSTDGGLIRACTDGNLADGTTLARIEAARDPIDMDWSQLVLDVSYDERMMPYYSDFATCLQTKGVPAGAATGNPFDYLSWADGERRDLPEADAHQLGLEQALTHVECGQEMFDARAELLASRRAGFIEEHRAQVQELAELMAEVGVK